MSKKYIILRRCIYLLFYISMLIFVFNLDVFSNFSFYQKIVSAPFYLVFKSLNTFLSFQESYFLSLLILSLIFMPIFTGLLGLVKKYATLTKKLIAIRKRTDLESTVKANMMLDEVENSNTSLLGVFLSFFSTYLFGYGISILTYGIFNSDLIESTNFNFLWFKIADNNLIFSLIVYVLFLFGSLFTLKQSIESKNRINFIITLVISISLFSVIFAPASVVLFLLINVLINYIKKGMIFAIKK